MNKKYLWIGGFFAILILLFLLYIGLIFSGVGVWPACTKVGCSDAIVINLPGLTLSPHFRITINNLSYDSCLDGYFKGTNIVEKRFQVDTSSQDQYYWWSLMVYPKGIDAAKGDSTSIVLAATDFSELDNINLKIEKRSPDCSKSDSSTILEKNIPLKYVRNKPNKGLFCGPICRSARITLPDFKDKGTL